MKIEINAYIKEIMQKIIDNNYQVYLVGGAVRDTITKNSIDDYDLVTDMPLEEIEIILPNFKLMKENDHRNTGISNINNIKIEISSLKGNNIIKDLSKRDFTINAIACDKDGLLIDPFNGLEDIKNKQLELVQKNGQGIDDDPLRILRALRFQSKLSYNISANTKNIIKEKSNLLSTVKEERIINELKQILTSSNVTEVIRDNKEVFSEIIKELKPTIGLEQNNPFHVYDVFEHTMKVIENVPNNYYLRLAALFHDLGKPLSATVDEKGITHFYRHEDKSEEIFKVFARKYKLDNKTTNIVSKIILNHDRTLSTKRSKIIKFIREYGEKEEIEYLFAIKKADILSQNPKLLYRLKELEQVKEKYHEIMQDSVATLGIKDLKINGHKLMKMGFFNQKIGIILKDVLNKVTLEELLNEEKDIQDYVETKYK